MVLKSYTGLMDAEEDSNLIVDVCMFMNVNQLYTSVSQQLANIPAYKASDHHI